MKTLKLIIGMGVVLMATLACVQVNAQSFITNNGSAIFTSTAPLLEFEGKSSDLNGLINLTDNTVDFYLDLNTLDTGIDLRNRHMRDSYLETAKHPFAEFTGQLNDNIDLEAAAGQTVTVSGVFKLHGVDKPISVQGTITPNADGSILLRASWQILLEDYNIKRPRVVFYELSDVQSITIEAKLIPNEP